MIDTLTLDAEVHGILTDSQYPHQERAVLATITIESAVRAEFGIPLGKSLPVPPEWRHRVPLSDDDVRADTEVVEVRLMNGSVLHLDNTEEVQTLNPLVDFDADAERAEIAARQAEVDAEMAAARTAIDFWGDDEPTEKPSLWHRFRSRMREQS